MGFFEKCIEHFSVTRQVGTLNVREMADAYASKVSWSFGKNLVICLVLRNLSSRLYFQLKCSARSFEL